MRWAIIILLLASSAVCLGQEESFNIEDVDRTPEYEPLNVIKWSPLALVMGQIPFIGEFRLVYERAIGSPRQSLSIGASYNFPNFITRAYFQEVQDTFGIDLNAAGYRIQGGYRFYLSQEEILEGYYVYPQISYNRLKLWNKQARDENGWVTFANINLILGYQTKVSNHILMDTGLGLGYRDNTYEYIDLRGRFQRIDILEDNPLGHLKITLYMMFAYRF